MNELEKEIFERLTATESSVKSLHKRVDRHDALIESIRSMTSEIKHMNENISNLTEKVCVLEARPAKRWESIVVAIISAIGGGLGGAILSAVIGG